MRKPKNKKAKPASAAKKPMIAIRMGGFFMSCIPQRW
jgi:hypothetical protein